MVKKIESLWRETSINYLKGYDMYVFEDTNGSFQIREMSGNYNENLIVATFDNVDRARAAFRSLKRGSGFQGQTPKFFCPISYSDNLALDTKPKIE